MQRFLLTVFTLLLTASAVQAQVPENKELWREDGPNIYIQLYPENNTVSPGDTVTVGIEQIIRPHWHTYWQNPGDSGEPMRVRWNYDESLDTTPKNSDLRWPTPKDIPYGPLVNYGYENKAVMMQDVTIPDDLPENEPVSIPVAFDILVCKDICIPETVETTLDINTGVSTNYTAFLNTARDKIPQSNHGFTSTLKRDGENTVLSVQTEMSAETLNEAEAQFYPYEYGLAAPSAAPSIESDGQTLTLTQGKGDLALEEMNNTSGVLVIEVDGERTGYEITPELEESTASAETTSQQANEGETAPSTNLPTPEIGLLSALIFALLGGVILNLMPCVFPVLSMKVLSLCRMSDHEQKEARMHGLAYTAGIILSFLAIAGLLIAFKSGGAQIGWGFQLQNPVVILLLAYLFFAIGLSLAGLFELGLGLMNVGQKWANRGGVSGSFLTGVLATIVATPCTAPFMAAALGYALVQPAYVALIVFAALGLGLALPYLVISFVPALQHILPKPGQWMVTFKEFLAFPMFATTAFFLWVLAQQEGSSIMLIVLGGLVTIGLGVWMLHKGKSLASTVGRILVKLIAILLIAGSLLAATFTVQTMKGTQTQASNPSFGQSFSESALNEALDSGKPVFVEMTADWCITCKMNHRVAIDTDQTRNVIEKRDIIYLVGDWTNYDDQITAYLDKFGRKGVPLYVYYQEPDPETGERAAPEILPQLLLPGKVAATLSKQPAQPEGEKS